jgi:hypothetical protein
LFAFEEVSIADRVDEGVVRQLVQVPKLIRTNNKCLEPAGLDPRIDPNGEASSGIVARSGDVDQFSFQTRI